MKAPFTIDIPQAALDDLKQRLADSRWPDEISGSGWEYGTNLDYLKEFCKYWQNDFDWRKQESYLNTFHHYRTSVNGFGIHYILEKGKGSTSFPLLLTHGYPDSFVRFLKIIPLLKEADKDGFSFDIVIPSIPGFGFSDKSHEKGMNPEKIADIFSQLMIDELGYKDFVAHGGDWGSSITEQLAMRCPQSLKAIHLTDVPYKHIFNVPTADLSEAEKKYLEAGKQWSMTEGAYAMIQSTKPQTLAYGINDSPVGLAAWIIEKFYRWSDNNGNLENSFTKDELLTNIMIYWVTQTINSSFRIYYESMHTPPAKDTSKPETPVAVAVFPRDLIPAPKDFAARVFNLKRFTEMNGGGHFAAMEEPELLATDIRNFFKEMVR